MDVELALSFPTLPRCLLACRTLASPHVPVPLSCRTRRPYFSLPTSW